MRIRTPQPIGTLAEHCPKASLRCFTGALVCAVLGTLGRHTFGATLDVMNYGAVPNDDGDDRAAIQSAITASASGDTVFFPTGVYRLSGAIYPKSGIRLEGSSASESALLYVGGSPSEIIGIGNVTNVTVTRLTLDGNSSTAVKDGILAGPASGLRLENLMIRNFGNAAEGPRGIRFDPDVTDSVIANNRIDNIGTGTAWGAGIRLSWRSSRNQVTDNVISNTGRGGIFCNDDSTDNVILRNTVTGSGGVKLGIEVWGGCHRTLIEDNRIDHWLSLDGSNYCAVRRNTVSDKSGSYAWAGLEAICQNSVFADNLVDGGAQVGISQSNWQTKEYNLFARNTIKDSAMFGLFLQGSSGPCQYQFFHQNNFLSSIGTQPPAQYSGTGDGMRFDQNCYYISFEANEISNNNHDGIWPFTAPANLNYLSFTNNTLQNNGNGGVWDGFGGDLEWTGNTISGNHGGGADWNTQLASRGFANQKPVAAFNAPLVAQPGQVVPFANTSADPDGSIGHVLWDFGNGLPSTATSPSFTFTAAGTYLVTLIVWDNAGRASRVTKTVTVATANNPPTISDVVNQTVNENTATAAIAFTVGDVETAAASLTVSGTSSNTALVPNANIVIGGSGANRTVTVTPAANQSGTATITLTVNDGTLTASDTFVQTVLDISDVLVAAGSTWKFLDTGADPGAIWMQNNFSDTTWPAGPSLLGFGDLNGQTPTTFINNTSSRITTYFRHSFSVADLRRYGDLTLRLLRDDGAVIWLNGVEVLRSNMAAAPSVITPGTQALAAVTAADENRFFTTTLDARVLRTGTNVIAVEVHQFGTASSDLGLDLSLIAAFDIPAPLIPAGATWKYRDTGLAPPANWTSSSYTDAAWSSGPARLGYGDTQATTLGYGGDANAKYLTTWFRHSFTVANATLFDTLRLELQRDDGAVVYLNGLEILRDNLPSSAVTPTTLATTSVGGADETAWNVFTVPATALVTGANTLAIELHQSAPTSSDLGLDVRLFGLRQAAFTFADWQATQFGSDKTNTALAGPLADLDKDGVITLFEYAFASDPRTPDHDALPTLNTASGRLALQFERNASATDITLIVQAASALSGPWTDLASSTFGNPFVASVIGTTILESRTGALRSVEVRDLYPLNDPAHPRRFMRLQVTTP